MLGINTFNKIKSQASQVILFLTKFSDFYLFKKNEIFKQIVMKIRLHYRPVTFTKEHF